MHRYMYMYMIGMRNWFRWPWPFYKVTVVDDIHCPWKTHHCFSCFIIYSQTEAFDYILEQVKEVRNRGDETARIVLAHQQEGQEPPGNLKRDFEHLLDLVSGDMNVFEPGHEKMRLCHMRTTKALISAFVVRSLDSLISLDSIAEISRL